MSQSTSERVQKHVNRLNAVPRRVCRHPGIRARLEAGPAEDWLRHYLPGAYPRPFERAHIEINATVMHAQATGRRAALAAERGIGKSTDLWGILLMLKLSGREAFPICVPWAASALKRAFRFWRNAICFNQRLIEDYPEFCAPFAHARGIPQRLVSTTWADNEKPTGAQLTIGDGIIVFPDNRGCIGGGTINRNIRGLNLPQPDGTVLRPTFGLLDDVQDREVASSEPQVAETISLIEGDIGGLAEAGKDFPMVVSGNCIAVGDVMDHFLSHPEWTGLRIPCVESWPDGWDAEEGEVSAVRELWAEWRDLDAEGKGDPFYVEHRALMTQGFRLSSPLAFRANVKAADEFVGVMRQYYKMGPKAFAAERQQQPISDRDEVEYTLTAAAIRKQVGPLPRGEVPADAAATVAFVDLNYHAAAWCILAGSNAPCYSVVDYGWWTPARGRPVWQSKGATTTAEIAIYHACESVVAMLLDHPNGKALGGIAIDCGNWASTVHAACKLLMARHGSKDFGIYAAKGFASTLYREPQRRPMIKKRGHLADVRFMGPDREQMMQWDSHSWHMLTQKGWLVPVGMPGSVCLYVPSARSSHVQFAEEAAADVLRGIVVRDGKRKVEWKTTGHNEQGDTVAGAAALLSTFGVRPDASDDTPANRASIRRERKAVERATAASAAPVQQPVPAVTPVTPQPARQRPSRQFRPAWGLRF